MSVVRGHSPRCDFPFSTGFPPLDVLLIIFSLLALFLCYQHSRMSLKMLFLRFCWIAGLGRLPLFPPCPISLPYLKENGLRMMGGHRDM